MLHACVLHTDMLYKLEYSEITSLTVMEVGLGDNISSAFVIIFPSSPFLFLEKSLITDFLNSLYSAGG
jgi:hypothetical protein